MCCLVWAKDRFTLTNYHLRLFKIFAYTTPLPSVGKPLLNRCVRSLVSLISSSKVIQNTSCFHSNVFVKCYFYLHRSMCGQAVLDTLCFWAQQHLYCPLGYNFTLLGSRHLLQKPYMDKLYICLMHVLWRTGQIITCFGSYSLSNAVHMRIITTESSRK